MLKVACSPWIQLAVCTVIVQLCQSPRVALPWWRLAMGSWLTPPHHVPGRGNVHLPYQMWHHLICAPGTSLSREMYRTGSTVGRCTYRSPVYDCVCTPVVHLQCKSGCTYWLYTCTEWMSIPAGCTPALYVCLCTHMYEYFYTQAVHLPSICECERMWTQWLHTKNFVYMSVLRMYL